MKLYFGTKPFVKIWKAFCCKFEVSKHKPVSQRLFITRWIENFSKMVESTNKNPLDKKRSICTTKNIERVCEAISNSPGCSPHHRAASLQLSRESVCWILVDNLAHCSYKLMVTQELKETAYKRCCEVGPWRPHKHRLCSHCWHHLFTSIRTVFSASYIDAISEFCDIDFAGQIVYKTRSFVSVFWGARANYSYLDTCSRLHASAASVRNCTFNVMVLRCIHYIIQITLNVLQTGHAIASQLEFEPDSPVQRAGFEHIKPSRPANWQ